jgi:hypothetical protein
MLHLLIDEQKVYGNNNNKNILFDIVTAYSDKTS